MKYWSIIVLLTVIFSCGENSPVSEVSKPTTHDLIQGNWISEEIDSSDFSHIFALYVEDSLFHLLSSYSDSVKFQLKDSIITVHNSTHEEFFGKKQKFKILKINNEELELLVLTDKWKQFLNRIQYPYTDTLRFTKIEEKNHLEPIKIGFSSSGCFGPCPSMALEIDENRNVKFYGSIFTELEGGYSGQIPKKMYEGILNQIRLISLTSLKKEYIAPWTDDQMRYLYIETSDTIITVESYGDYMQPYELSIVYGNLMDAYKRLHLNQDTTIDNNLPFENHLIMNYPIPPPPKYD